MRRLLSEFFNDQSGATAIEYCLIAAGLSIVIVAARQRHRQRPQHQIRLGEYVAEVTAGRQQPSCKNCCSELGAADRSYSQQNPWRVFAMVLVTILLLDLMFRKQSSARAAAPTSATLISAATAATAGIEAP